MPHGQLHVSFTRDEKKQRRGPETAGESLIGIRTEPPQQGSRGPVMFVFVLGTISGISKEPFLLGVVKGVAGRAMVMANRTLLKLGYGRRSSSSFPDEMKVHILILCACTWNRIRLKLMKRVR